MDERPWTIIATEDALMVGLGRPKMGQQQFHKTVK